ncbi:MAG: alkaline phosphatase family protein [Kiloniellales bacterium]
MAEQPRRVLIAAFDGLRPDMATPALMPNLTAFAGAGVRFSASRSTFPTETRVNQSALITGCYPARHGIVGNKFLDPAASPGKLFNTGDETELAAADRRLDGRLMDVPVLGEVLASHGMSLAVISAGTPGGTRMLHHKAERLGHFRLALHRPDASVPADQITAVIDRLGPIPEHHIPSLGWLTYTTDAYLEHVEPELAPEVSILWLCEPDNSYHYRGIGTAANLAAIRHADAEFGRIMAWRGASGIGDRLQVITLSDHGQLTVSGPAVDVAGALVEAGITVGETLSDAADAALALGNAGGIYVRDSDPDLIQAIVRLLQRQPWCGPVFTRTATGTLALDQVGVEHRRAPDIGLALKSDDAPNAHGLPGACRHDSHYPVGGGVHGGLHRIELDTWFAAAGDAWREGHVSALPAGIVDVMPTVLHILGLQVPGSVQGRVLHEGLRADTHEPPPEARRQTFTAEGWDGFRAHLSLSRVGATVYLDRGWVD